VARGELIGSPVNVGSVLIPEQTTDIPIAKGVEVVLKHALQKREAQGVKLSFGRANACPRRKDPGAISPLTTNHDEIWKRKPTKQNIAALSIA
jgi:hypothetical protein